MTSMAMQIQLILKFLLFIVLRRLFDSVNCELNVQHETKINFI